MAKQPTVKIVTTHGIKWIIPKLRKYSTLARVLVYRGGREHD